MSDFTRARVRDVMETVRVALQGVSTAHHLRIEIGGAEFRGAVMTVKLQISTADAAAKAGA